MSVAVEDAIAQLDTMPAGRGAVLLAECCGSSRWVTAMLARRPFATRDQLFDAASQIWRSLDADDWLEAFAHHPRIGERASDRMQGARGESWSLGEQSGMAGAPADTRDALVKANRAYEQRFGFIYIVCATGRSAEEMLTIIGERLHHDLHHELTVAAEEQRKITKLRLDKLLETMPVTVECRT